MVFSIIHSFVKHTLVFIAPIIIIFITLAITIPDTSLHKQVLRDRGFYKTLSSEIQQYADAVKNNSISRAANLEGVIQQSVIAYAIADISSESFWQTTIESNLDNIKLWLNSPDYQGDDIALFWPDDQIQSLITSNSNSINAYIQQNSAVNEQCQSQELEQNKNSIEKLNCYISDISQLRQTKETQQVTGKFGSVSPDSFEWFDVLRIVKLVFNVSRYVAIPLAVVYLSLIMLVIVTSYTSHQRAKQTSMMIFGRIGVSTLVACVLILISFTAFSYFGLAGGMFFSSDSNLLSFANIIQMQINAHVFAMILPAIVVSVASIAASFALRLFPDF